VNDTFGHATGDALLVGIAERLRTCIPDPANAARLGGDEFAALLEFAQDADVSALVARRILSEIQRPILIDGQSVRVGATVGVAIGPADGLSAEGLIHAADIAMYEGKKAGRGVVRISRAA
jgi:diguanylate cyclase (GGDEF)-like protein